MKKGNKENKIKTKIGGQAVMEGVMMQSPTSLALAVRDENGQIQIDSRRLPKRSRIHKIPFIRGVVNFVASMITGVKTLLKSAEVAIGDDVELSNDSTKTGVLYGISMLLGFALAIGLFIVLPTQLSQWIGITSPMWKLVVEGLLKTAIMIGYFYAVSLIKDIKRTFMYHGAEHKTIACFEAGLSLTVENARPQSKHHDRCGTSFIVFVIIVSILMSMLFGLIAIATDFDAFFDKTWVRSLVKLALLPLTASICYELLMFLASTDAAFFRPLKWLGKQMQRITTKEPTDDMLEVAIAAFKEVQRLDGSDEEVMSFPAPIKLKEFREQVKGLLQYKTVESSDVDWILCAVLGVKRSKLSDDLLVPYGMQIRVQKMLDRCAKGEPLQYVLGNTEFFGMLFAVSPDCLIPRPETELVCEQAIKLCENRRGAKVLDLCCGSGCIGITVAVKCPKVQVTCSDISKKALQIAKKNAESNKAEINFMCGDMFKPFNAPFDIIVCNPPYIRTADIDTLDTCVKDHEPRIALDGGEDGLNYYRQLAEQAPKFLYAGGRLVLEIGYDQAKQVCGLLAQSFTVENVRKDYSGNDRIIVATLKEKH